MLYTLAGNDLRLEDMWLEETTIVRFLNQIAFLYAYNERQRQMQEQQHKTR